LACFVERYSLQIGKVLVVVNAFTLDPLIVKFFPELNVGAGLTFGGLCGGLLAYCELTALEYALGVHTSVIRELFRLRTPGDFFWLVLLLAPFVLSFTLMVGEKQSAARQA
jgi:hypothetical protein